MHRYKKGTSIIGAVFIRNDRKKTNLVKLAV